MHKFLILDGAVGTQLNTYNISLQLPIWSANANIDYPEIVTKIHKEYILAGADIITTNTFRSTPYTYRKIGFSDNKAYNYAKNSFFKAVDCAYSAIKKNIKIAGSITSVEDCYNPKKFPGKLVAQDTYEQLLEWFTECEIDIIIFETMGNIKEINIALDLVANINKPVWVSLIMKTKDTLLDGTSIEKTLKLIDSYDIDLLLINCNNIDLTIKISKNIQNIRGLDIGLYPNLGFEECNNSFNDIIDDENLKKHIKSILNLKPAVIGLCCGSSPSHIKLLRSIIREHK